MTNEVLKNQDINPGDVIVTPKTHAPNLSPKNYIEFFGLNGTRHLGESFQYLVLSKKVRTYKDAEGKDVEYLYFVVQRVRDTYQTYTLYCGTPDGQVMTKGNALRKAELLQALEKTSGKVHGITVGADPEIFLRDAKTKQTIPAFTILVDKAEASKHGEETPYWDGFQAEFNTKPNQCLAYQIDSIAQSLQNLVGAAQTKLAKRKDVQLSTKTVIDLHTTSFKDARKEHIEFGCMPSLNAYRERNKMADGAEVPFRMAGGHLHFGWETRDRPDRDECELMVKNLDRILGVYCVALFHKYDDKRRRALYGRAGEYRKPPHGLEYRVLSNAWLIHPVFAHLVFELGRLCITTRHIPNLWDATEEETRACINNCDLRLAKKLLMRNADVLKALLSSVAEGSTDNAERLFKLAFDGADSILDTATTLETRWNVNTPTNWVTHSGGHGKNIRTAMVLVRNGQKLR